jgi:predicted regulator of Ras-like GTPase activity (Roadblock/LC7/MglB family)
VDPVATLLASLRDVDGVQGSFFLTDKGELMAWDIPATLTESCLDEVGQRVVRLAEMFDLVIGRELHVCTIAFGSAKLFVNRAAPGFLCILTEPGIQLTATRMAATLVTRQLGSELERQRVGGSP